MMTELHEVAGGRVEPEAIQYDLQHLFARQKNVQLVTDTVVGIDKEQKIVKTKLGSYPFDQLILEWAESRMTLVHLVSKHTDSLFGHLKTL